LGRKPEEVFPFLQKGGFMKRLERALVGEPTPTIEFPFELPETDRQGWASDTTAPLRDHNGNITGAIANVRDITELKQTEEQLRHSQKMEAIGRLAGGVAHDFRNQLTVIKGYTSMLLRDQKMEEDQRKKLQSILDASDQSAMVASQLLAFSRKDMLQATRVDLQDVLRDVSNTLPRLIGEDIRLQISLGDERSFVEIDTTQLQQTIFNLASNARDAMPDGGKFTIETSVVDFAEGEEQLDLQAGKYVVMSVNDTGCGMDAKTLENVFEPFFTTKPVDKGTGLGLSMVYGFMKQSGGAVEIESTPSEGSTFRLYFPQVAPAVGVEALVSSPVATPGGTEKVLIAEDSAPIRNLLIALLEECGYKVLAGKDVDEVLSITQSYGERIDLLITDVVMPGMNGKVLADRVMAARPGIPVLFISGYAAEEILQRGVDIGHGNFLRKPFSPNDLAAAVRRSLDQAARDTP